MEQAIILPLPLAILLAFIGVILAVAVPIIREPLELRLIETVGIAAIGALLAWAGVESLVRMFS